jgi:outer membrane protein
MLKNSILRSVSAVLLLAALMTASGGSAVPDTLSLDSYVQLALQNNPQLKITAAQVLSGKASYSSAQSGLFPQVALKGQATQGNASYTDATNDQYSVGVSGSQLLYDFGKTGSQIRQAVYSLASTRASDLSSRLSVTVTAKTAYFNFLLAQKVLTVARESLKQSEQHLKDAQTQFEIGKQAKYAVIKAEVDVANAKVNLIKAGNGVKSAMVGLETVAGVPLPPAIRFIDSLAMGEVEIPLDQALSRADSLRPDLHGATAKVEAARSLVAASRAAFLPDINASAGYSYQKKGTSDWKDNWSIGASLTQPVFQGGAIKAGLRQSEATLAQAEAALEQARQNARAEVSQAIIDKQDAQERITAAVKFIEGAELGLSLSQERFRAGAATFIEVTDAEVALVNAHITHAQALYDYRVAHAKLLQAVGIQ